MTLAQGRVEVRQAGKANSQAAPVTLTAGERVDVAAARPATPVAVDVASATGWTSGRLTFRDVRLAEAVAEINRYSRRQIVLGGQRPADLRVNGVFDAGDTEAFVSGVTALLDLKSAPRPDGGVELTARRAGPA